MKSYMHQAFYIHRHCIHTLKYTYKYIFTFCFSVHYDWLELKFLFLFIFSCLNLLICDLTCTHLNLYTYINIQTL